MRIYIIEDEETIRRALRRSLRHPRIEIRDFAEPFEAIEAAKSEEIDLVVSDYSLPGLNGVCAIDQIRKLQPSARTVVLSGNSPDDVICRAMKDNVVDRYMAKPWRHAELRALVDELVSVPG
jgi:two-component system probable response regulator PhcQ